MTAIIDGVTVIGNAEEINRLIELRRQPKVIKVQADPLPTDLANQIHSSKTCVTTAEHGYKPEESIPCKRCKQSTLESVVWQDSDRTMC